MKSRYKIAMCVLVLAGCADEPNGVVKPQFANNGVQQSVSGHVELVPDPSITIEKYSFNAIRHKDGSVSGEFVVRDEYAEVGRDRIKGHVTCFTILPDGKTARVAGIIDTSTEPLVPAGRAAVWTVRDNGEGGKSEPDLASDLRWGFFAPAAEFHCNVGIASVNAVQLPSERGNIQVKP